MPSPRLPASSIKLTSRATHRQRLIVRLLGSICGLRPVWRVGHLVVHADSEGLEHVGPSGVWQAADGWVTQRGPSRVAGACLYAPAGLPHQANVERHTADKPRWLSSSGRGSSSRGSSSVMSALQTTPIRPKGGTESKTCLDEGLLHLRTQLQQWSYSIPCNTQEMQSQQEHVICNVAPGMRACSDWIAISIGERESCCLHPFTEGHAQCQ